MCLSTALKLGKLITDNCPNVKVIYTRKTDVFVELYRRAQIANTNKADLFISIHCNAAENHSAGGTETWVMGLHKSEANLAVARTENAAMLKEKNYENNYEGYNSAVKFIMRGGYAGICGITEAELLGTFGTWSAPTTSWTAASNRPASGYSTRWLCPASSSN